MPVYGIKTYVIFNKSVNVSKLLHL